MMSASAYERRSGLRLLPAAGPLTARAKLTRDLLTVGAKTDLTRVTPRHAIKAGLDAVLLRPSEDLAYDYSGYRDLTHLAGLPHIHVTDQTIAFADRKSGGEVSGFVQDSVDLGARVSANVGLRVDRYQLVIADTHVSPRVNVAVHAGGGAVLHASYNHFFVPPAIEGVLSSSAGLTRSIREIAVPLPALKATIENQFEAGASAPWGPLQLGLTGYYRATDNPVHTTVWPDSRIYSYASFDRARAYGLEAKADAPALARYGVTGYVNYALGRVHFYNPVTGGFVTEAAHLAETDRFLAPMDQTHTLTGGATYRHAGTGIWLGTAVEYGSGTPIGHGGADHEHAEGEADHTHEAAGEAAARVPGHLAGNLSVGVDVWRGANRRPKLTLRVDVENVTNHAYLIARDSEFSPSQYSNPRLISATARIRF
jgi:outer membrane receptor protein involved in Fe transport